MTQRPLDPWAAVTVLIWINNEPCILKYPDGKHKVTIRGFVKGLEYTLFIELKRTQNFIQRGAD